MCCYHQITLRKFEEKITTIGDKTSRTVMDADIQWISSVLCVCVFNLLNQ